LLSKTVVFRKKNTHNLWCVFSYRQSSITWNFWSCAKVTESRF